MKGINMGDLYDYLKNNHEIEFLYDNNNYTIQPGGLSKEALLSLWIDIPNSNSAKCVYEYCEADVFSITDDIIKKFLNKKYFNNKSFIEVEDDITVTVIY